MQVLELVDDAVCIRAWMQGAELTGCIALANAAVALQLAAESQQVLPCPKLGQDCRPAHARPLDLDQLLQSKGVCRHGLMQSRASGGPQHAPCCRPVPAAGHAQLQRHSSAHAWRTSQGVPATCIAGFAQASSSAVGVSACASCLDLRQIVWCAAVAAAALAGRSSGAEGHLQICRLLGQDCSSAGPCPRLSYQPMMETRATRLHDRPLVRSLSALLTPTHGIAHSGPDCHVIGADRQVCSSPHNVQTDMSGQQGHGRTTASHSSQHDHDVVQAGLS